MNKKLLGVFVSVLAVAMLVAPVMAMKGQTKQDFKLVFQGLPVGGEVWEADGNTVNRDVDFIVFGDIFVQVGAGGATEDLSKDYLEYEGIMNFVTHTKPSEWYSVIVVETIFIYSSTDHTEENLRGTLMITAIGDNRGGNGGNFVGHGTGDFEGVKIKGTSTPLELVPDAASPVGFWIQLIRTGTVMGWP